MNTIHFIPLTTEQLHEVITSAVKTQLEPFAKLLTPTEPDQYLTRAEVAKILKVNLSTVNNWKREGKLKGYGIGNRVYFLASELNEFVKPIIISLRHD